MLDQNDLKAIAQLIHTEIVENNETLRAEMKENNESLINQFNAVIESTVMPEIRAVAEGHQIILDRLPEVDKVSDLEDRVGTLERIVQMQRQELNALKGA